MPTYPCVKYDFQSACIQLDSELSINDTLFIKLGGNALNHIFNTTHITQFKSNPDFELYILNCRITYDIEWHYLYLESLFRDYKFDYAYIRRTHTNLTINGNIIPVSEPSLVFDLESYIPAANDIVDYYINGISYYYRLDKIRLHDLYTDTGYLLNSANHRLKVTETYLGRKLFIIAGQSTDIFTNVGTFTEGKTYVSKTSNTVSPPHSSYVIFPIKDQIRENDYLNITTAKSSYSYTFTATDLAQLMTSWQLSFTNYKIRFIPVYYGPLRVYNVELTLTDNTDNILICSITQPIAQQHFFCEKIKHNYKLITSNPVYDTADEQLFHSRSELDHIKQRCICALAGAFQNLKDSKVYKILNSDAQKIRDQIMDYIIYPNTCLLETKQYIWDNYGPFTSPRPIGSPILDYIDPPSDSYGQPSLGLYINLYFKDNVQLGCGEIILYPVTEITLLSTDPNNNSLGNSRVPTIYLTFNDDVKLGYGKIILEAIDTSMAVINGTSNVRLSGLITLSLPTNMKLYPGIGKIKLVPIVT